MSFQYFDHLVSEGPSGQLLEDDKLSDNLTIATSRLDREENETLCGQAQCTSYPSARETNDSFFSLWDPSLMAEITLAGSSSSNAALFGLSIPGLRWLCHLLHLCLLVLHIVLIGVYVPYRTRRLVVPISQSHSWLPTALSVCLQAFYTIYGTVLVALAQRLCLIYALQKRQKLTAIADASSAWSGLGSAIIALWNNARIPASISSSAIVTVYLACAMVLHVVGGNVMSLQAFNQTVNVQITTKMAWHGAEDTSIFETDANNEPDWQTIDALVSGVARLDALTVQGLNGSSIYDTVNQPNMATGIAQVNASTIGFECGLIPNTNLTAISINGSFQIAWTYQYGGFAVPWADQVLLVPHNTDGISETDIDLLYMVTTALTPSESTSVVDDFAVSLNWTYIAINSSNGNQEGTINQEIRVFFAGCSMSISSGIVGVEVQTNMLQNTPPIGRSQQGLWKGVPEGTYPAFNVTKTAGSWLANALSQGPQSNISITNGQDRTYTISLIDYHLMQQLGIYIAYSTDLIGSMMFQGPPEPTFVLNVTDLEDALAEMAAAMLWTGSRLSQGGYQSPTGSTEAWQSVLAWSLDINLIPLLFGFFASLIMLSLAIWLGGMRHRDNPSILNVGILEMVWLAERDPSMRSKFGDVEKPTVDKLRAAGMFEVCLSGA